VKESDTKRGTEPPIPNMEVAVKRVVVDETAEKRQRPAGEKG
jgi:hypothetical protein